MDTDRLLMENSEVAALLLVSGLKAGLAKLGRLKLQWRPVQEIL